MLIIYPLWTWDLRETEEVSNICQNIQFSIAFAFLDPPILLSESVGKSQAICLIVNRDIEVIQE